MISHLPDGSVEFAFYRPGAHAVHLAADFNRWSPQMHALARDERGWWRLTLRLVPGEYRFKYLVDGHIWEADFAAFGVEPDDIGGWHSRLWVADHRLLAA